MERAYSQQLGMISDAQFQAALDHFNLGRFIRAEPIPFGLFGQNVFLTSTTGDYVLRGKPHFWWQFPTEQFYTRFISENTRVPAPWPYLIDTTTDTFGWSYALMPRMPGLQLADPQVKARLTPLERHAIARTLGAALADIQKAKWPIAGRYSAASASVEPFERARELAWPFPVEAEPPSATTPPVTIPYGERVKACLRHQLASKQTGKPDATTSADIAWVEGYITDAQQALDDSFEPCLVMEDYKRENLVVLGQGDEWRVSGVFDLMGAYFGDGEADLSRQYAIYLDEDPPLAQEFLRGYLSQTTPRPGFAQRFPVYMLLDRAIIWAFLLRHEPDWWDKAHTFRDWASHYLTPEGIV